MLIFRVLKKSNNTLCFKCKNIRFLNVQTNLENNVEPIKRKYLKPLSSPKLQPWGGSNLNNIITGTIDKRIFTYPSVFKNDDVDTVLNHSAVVEDYLSRNTDTKLTNNNLQKLKELELFGLTTPQEFGGAGYSETETKFLLECAGRNPNLARFVGYKEDFCCRIINQYGNEEQKNKYLPALADGRLFMSAAFLEKGPLIDFSKIEGHVILNSEQKNFILNAEKKWVHYADKADIFLVLVKSIQVNKVDSEMEQKLNIFFVENNLPGVQLHKLKSPWADEADLYEISFKDVKIPFSNVLGSIDINGFNALKLGISHSNMTDATLCLSLMKRMFHEAVQYVEVNNLKDIKIRGHLHVRENIVTFLSYVYALESVIYLLIGNLDLYEKPDLFNDAIMAKALAIDFLRTSIKIFTEIIGYDSFKKSEIMEEALKAVQFYSIFDENIEYFKLMGGADGLISAGPKLQQQINIHRDPLNNPFKSLKHLFMMESREKKFKSDLKIKMELHSSLQVAADIIEDNILNIHNLTQILFCEEGSLALYNEHVITKLTEIASYIFAGIACLSRASTSICYNLNNYNDESIITQAFIKMIDTKIKCLHKEELRHSELVEYYRVIGKNTMFVKQYPLDHPLSRAF